MADITVHYESTCAGGNHVTFGVYVGGMLRKHLTYEKSEFLNPPAVDWETVLLAFMVEACKKAGATTLAQCRTAIEAKTWSI